VITLTCDNCDKPFEIEDDAVGQKASCPYCGDINRVPAPPAAPVAGAAVKGTVVASAPVAPKPVSASPSVGSGAGSAASSGGAEQHITVVRQAMFRAHPFWYTLLVLIGVGGLVLAVLAKTGSQIPSPHIMVWVGVAMMAIAILWWLIWWGAPHRWVKLVITNKRTIRQEGIVVRKTSEVLHNHIRNVKIEQSFLQRLLGVGSISIDSAGGSEHEMIEIQMDNVPQPYKVKETLDRFRKM
jgi:membrane protein YdbS with pleckstrin-like domain